MAMRRSSLAIAFAVLAAFAACATRAVDYAAATPIGLGHAASAADIGAWDGDVAIDGTGLPMGSGAPARGAQVFEARCAACHARGAGLGRVRMNWPYATSLFDYVRRAMPPDRAKPLAANDLYAVTAYILANSGAIAPNDVMDRTTLPRVTMPGKQFFRRPDGTTLP